MGGPVLTLRWLDVNGDGEAIGPVLIDRLESSAEIDTDLPKRWLTETEARKLADERGYEFREA